jgi:CHAT domain-containing protein
MVEFYRQLEQTDNKAQALRQAMLTMKEKYSRAHCLGGLYPNW